MMVTQHYAVSASFILVGRSLGERDAAVSKTIALTSSLEVHPVVSLLTLPMQLPLVTQLPDTLEHVGGTQHWQSGQSVRILRFRDEKDV